MVGLHSRLPAAGGGLGHFVTFAPFFMAEHTFSTILTLQEDRVAVTGMVEQHAATRFQGQIICPLPPRRPCSQTSVPNLCDARGATFLVCPRGDQTSDPAPKTEHSSRFHPAAIQPDSWDSGWVWKEGRDGEGLLALEAVPSHLSMRLAVLDVVLRHELRSLLEIQNPNRLKKLRLDGMSPSTPFLRGRPTNTRNPFVASILWAYLFVLLVFEKLLPSRDSIATLCPCDHS
jgi:hypothetical protein